MSSRRLPASSRARSACDGVGFLAMRVDGEALDRVVELGHRLVGGDQIAPVHVDALDAPWHFERDDVLVVLDQPLVAGGDRGTAVTADESEESDCPPRPAVLYHSYDNRSACRERQPCVEQSVRILRLSQVLFGTLDSRRRQSLLVNRRALTLGLAAATALPRARADSIGEEALEIRPLHLEHEVVLALPPASMSPAPLVVLLHGLAETSDEHAGARAWVDRYGLADSVRRLVRAPLARISTARDDWGDTLATTNAALAARPYRGLGFACPYVPKMSGRDLDGYARWIDSVLVPRVRNEAGGRLDASPARIGGCSYGGWVSLEVFLRVPHGFGAWAGVQTAILARSGAGIRRSPRAGGRRAPALD